MPRLLHNTRQRLRRFFLESANVQITPDAHLEAGVVCRPGRRDGHAGAISVGAECKLDTGVVLDAWGGSITINDHVFIGPYTVIYGQGGVTIGAHCLIAMHCRILSSEHTIPRTDVPIRSQPDLLKPTRIGRDVWLGAGVTVLGGVTIGDGCIIGAGSVVTRDLPAGSISHGVPAQIKDWRDGANPPGR